MISSGSDSEIVDIRNILDEIVVQGLKFQENETKSREVLLARAHDLVAALENPIENIYRYMLGEPSRMFATRMALDLQFFETLAAEDFRPKSVKELAATKNASPKLVRRLIRHLTAMKMVDQTGDDEYASNRISKPLALAKYREGFCYCFDAAGPSFVKMPEYLSNTNFENPENMNDGPFQFAHNTPNHWVWIQQHPRVERAFHDYLTGIGEGNLSFTDPDFYPVEDRLVKGLDLADGSAASAFVDVGGGTGHALAELKSKVPSWKGRLVLQEQKSVVEIAKTEPHAPMIEAMVHDFFKSQPLQGARAYYMRYILHDWHDEGCQTILRNLKDAMTPGYSKILIHDCVIDDRNPSWQHTALDLYVMAILATEERTEKDWRALLDSVGLRVTGIWKKGAGSISLIEAML